MVNKISFEADREEVRRRIINFCCGDRVRKILRKSKANDGMVGIRLMCLGVVGACKLLSKC